MKMKVIGSLVGMLAMRAGVLYAADRSPSGVYQPFTAGAEVGTTGYGPAGIWRFAGSLRVPQQF